MGTSEEVFAALKEFFESPDVDSVEQRKVWTVLTALRGPDFPGTYHVKSSVTTVIRRKLFGGGSGIGEFADMERDAKSSPSIRVSLQGKQEWEHFLRHAREAFRVLGLKWEEVNE